MAIFVIALFGAIAITGILAACGIVLVVSAGIRAEDRRGTLAGMAPSRTARTARRWTGMGARWAKAA